jgi:hypothetical protein
MTAVNELFSVPEHANFCVPCGGLLVVRQGTGTDVTCRICGHSSMFFSADLASDCTVNPTFCLFLILLISSRMFPYHSSSIHHNSRVRDNSEDVAHQAVGAFASAVRSCCGWWRRQGGRGHCGRGLPDVQTSAAQLPYCAAARP